MEFVIFVFVIIVGYLIYSSIKKNKKEESPEEHFPLKIRISYQGGDYFDESTPVVDPNEVWIPRGQPVNVAGYQINDGLIYVGEGLRSVNSNYRAEPSLIDPKLEINKTNSDYYGSSMSYWPSYSSITPGARSAYLDWLASGRNNPTTNIGYVFLFFYGLERRLLIDAETSDEAKSEASEIIAEVERLLSIYGSNGSFNGYASNFLDVVRFKFLKGGIPLKNQHPTQWGEYPLSLKVALSRFSTNQQPIPPKFALYWTEQNPDTYLRTPAKRCREEFEKLFEIRYRQKFGDGLVVKPNKSRIKVEYKSATNSFTARKFEIGDMPDITQLTKPVSHFREVIELCTDELDAYSRYIGRRPEEKTSLEALSLLPEELLREVEVQRIVELQSWLGDLMKDVDIKYIDANELLNQWGVAPPKSLTKAQCVSIARLLGKLGYAIEPDIRFSSDKIDPTGKVVLSHLDDNSLNTASKDYTAATTVLQLASAVCAADGNVSEEEELHLENHLEAALELSEHEKRRLRVYLKWLLISTPGFSGMKKKLASLDLDSKKSLAQFLLSVAFADGIIDPGEIKILKKIYGLLELDTESIYSDLHKLQAVAAIEPVTIQEKPENSEEYLIPKEQTIKTQIGEGTLILDQGLIRKKREDTIEIQKKLGEILAEEDTEKIPDTHNQNQIIDKEETILGLDGQHSKLVKELLNMNSLSRSDFEDLCDKYGLMPDGAIETINNSSFDLHDEPLIEEDDDIEVNQELCRELSI